MESTFPLVIFSNESSSFKNAGAVMVIDATDVLDPAARNAVGTPIY